MVEASDHATKKKSDQVAVFATGVEDMIDSSAISGGLLDEDSWFLLRAESLRRKNVHDAQETISQALEPQELSVSEILPTETGLHTKRRRVERACEFCRRRKLKCDDQRPCSSCAGRMTGCRDCHKGAEWEAQLAALGKNAGLYWKMRNNVSQACDRCRKLKSKCGDTRPCWRCVKSGCADKCVDEVRTSNSSQTPESEDWGSEGENNTSKHDPSSLPSSPASPVTAVSEHRLE
eukprot:765308-Hanusia_phi.AAC.8